MNTLGSEGFKISKKKNQVTVTNNQSFTSTFTSSTSNFTNYNNSQNTSNVTVISTDPGISPLQKGKANGLATLDTNGKIPLSQLPTLNTIIREQVKEEILQELAFNLANVQNGEVPTFDAATNSWIPQAIPKFIKHANIRNLNNTQNNIVGKTQLIIDGLQPIGSFSTLEHDIWVNNKITPSVEGEIYLARVSATIISHILGGIVGLSLDIGTDSEIIIYKEDFQIHKNPETKTWTILFYASSTFVQNGGKLYITNTNAISLSNISLYIIKLL